MERKGIGQVSDLGNLIIGQDDLNDVDADTDLRFVDGPQVVEDGLGDEASFAAVDRGGRPQPLAGGPGLHFDEREAMGIFEDKVNLTASSAIIGGEETETGGFEMFAGRLFPALSALEVDGQCRWV